MDGGGKKCGLRQHLGKICSWLLSRDTVAYATASFFFVVGGEDADFLWTLLATFPFLKSR